MEVRTQSRESWPAAPGGDGALHLRPSARLPDLLGQRRLRAAGHGRRRRPARGALRLEARTTSSAPERRGEPRFIPKDDSNPYFDFDPAKCIVCSRCVRACDEVQGTFALTIEGRGFDAGSRPAGGRRLPRVRVRVLRRLRAGLPDRDAAGEVGRRARHADPLGAHHLRLLRRRLLVQGRAAAATRWSGWCPTRTARPTRATPASRAASPSATPPTPTGSLKPMIRETITDPWREVTWDEAIGYAADAVRGASRPSTGAARSAASPRRAAPTKRSTSSRSWCGRPSATTTSTPAPGSATRRPATGSKQTFGTSAGTQDFEVGRASRRRSMVIGANPTDGHPVFASRMKRRLRQGAKLIVIDPRRIDLVRSPHIEADAPPAAAARHQRGGDQRDGARRRHRGAGGRGLRPRAVRGRVRRSGREFIARAANTARRRSRRSPASRPPSCAPRPGSTPPAATGRSTTASASPSTARARRW